MNDQNITIPLSELLYILLGDYYGSTHGSAKCEVPPKTGLILAQLFKTSTTHKVVWDNDVCVLWHLKAWNEDLEILRRRKEYSDKRRIEHWIREANHKLIAQAMIRKTPALPYSHASMMAMRMLNNIDTTWPVVHEYWGVRKLITSVEEL